MTDEEIVQQLAVEMPTCGEMEIVLNPQSVLSLVGVLQLALRHPSFVEGAAHDCAQAFIAGAREYFADCPTVLEVLRRGDDPAQDVPAWPDGRIRHTGSGSESGARDAAAIDALVQKPERTDRLLKLLVHLIGHQTCTGYVVALTDDTVASITCLRCGLTSFNPTDIAEKYCGHCHRLHEGTRP